MVDALQSISDLENRANDIIEALLNACSGNKPRCRNAQDRIRKFLDRAPTCPGGNV
jgi:hypothetical protein